MARPRTHTPELRQRLIDAAVDAVAQGGIGALALRELAEQTGTSTSAVYAFFGSKEALQCAVLERAMEGFGAAQEAVPVTDDPVLDAAWLGAAYVGWAMENPRLYGAMFGDAITGIEPTPELEAARERAMSHIIDAVRRAQAAGAFRPEAEATVVASLWAQVHGLVTLHIGGHLSDDADPAVAALATIEGWRAEQP